MEEGARRYLEKVAIGDGDGKEGPALPPRFFDRFVMQGLRLDLVEPGRIVCSIKVPPRLLVTLPPSLSLSPSPSPNPIHITCKECKFNM